MNNLQSRRRFITSVTAGIAGSYGLLRSQPDETFLTEQSDLIAIQKPERFLPPALAKGSTIAITAPASPTSEWEIRNCVKLFRNMGFKVEIGETITKRDWKFRYLSASDESRAIELMKFASRPDISCILCGRGGYGVMRILQSIDYAEFLKNPKIVVGFSDITALINAIYKTTGMVCYHGPLAVSTFSAYTKENLMSILKPGNNHIGKPVKFPVAETLVPGKAMGKLTGGNLTMITSTLGTPFEIDTTDAILFIEEVSEDPYKIDRMLTQLWLSGKLQSARAIAIGFFSGLNTKRPFFPGGSFTIKQVIEQRILPMEVPTLLGLPIGHVESQLTLPIGIEVELDATKKSLTFLEPAVSYD